MIQDHGTHHDDNFSSPPADRLSEDPHAVSPADGARGRPSPTEKHAHKHLGLDSVIRRPSRGIRDGASGERW
eukprot:1291731-Rhodomonas_salina.2